MGRRLWDKGRVRLGEGRWYTPYYADVGPGSSNWTWQALLGVGYAFDWGDINLSIRSLSYDFNGKNDADLRLTSRPWGRRSAGESTSAAVADAGPIEIGVEIKGSALHRT